MFKKRRALKEQDEKKERLFREKWTEHEKHIGRKIDVLGRTVLIKRIHVPYSPFAGLEFDGIYVYNGEIKEITLPLKIIEKAIQSQQLPKALWVKTD